LGSFGQVEEQMEILGVDRPGGSNVQELAPVAPHDAHVQARQHRLHGNIGHLIHIGTGQTHDDRLPRIDQRRQFDIGHQRLPGVGAHHRLAQLGGLGAGEPPRHGKGRADADEMGQSK
jgi:hypothetical protein